MNRRKTELKDFLHDDEFVRWVLHPTGDSEKYWRAWLDAHPDSKMEVQKARELILAFNFDIRKPKEFEKEEVLESILKSVNTSKMMQSRDHTGGRILWITSVAASLLLIALFSGKFISTREEPNEGNPIASNELIVKKTPTGVKMQTKLPDGSNVWLNSESKITYGPDYGWTTRKVYLEGEAYFEVVKDAKLPFVVHSGKLKITALGTSFNVNAIRADESSVVALVTGKVEVIKEGEKTETIILNPGQKVTHNVKSSTLVMAGFSFEREIGWKNGILSFENACFDEVKTGLERWYGVTIQSNLRGSKDWNYTGKFDNQSLEIVLKRLAYSKKFQFEMKDNTVYLYN